MLRMIIISGLPGVYYSVQTHAPHAVAAHMDTNHDSEGIHMVTHLATVLNIVRHIGQCHHIVTGHQR